MSTPSNIEQVEKILTALVGFDTVSRNSNRALIDWVRDYLAGFGVASEIVESEDGAKASLWATIGNGKNGVVIAGHTDVVPVEGQQWTSSPFTLTERDGKFYGRGAVDMKGFIACALAFVPEFLAATIDTCFHLALTHDEESDMSGAKRLADYLVAKKIAPEWIWIGEPTDLRIIDQHKGVSAYRAEITGVSGHSGKPDKGLSAIEIAHDLMGVITEVAQHKKQNAYVDSRLDPPYTTFNLATIAGGTAENIIPEHCTLVWQSRAHPGDSAQDDLQNIETRATEKFGHRFAPFAPKAGMKICTCFDIPAFQATANNRGVQILGRALKCDETHAVSFGTEAGIFQKLGVGAVVCGPGSIDQAHQPDEFIDKSQLIACVDLMRTVLLCSSAPL